MEKLKEEAEEILNLLKLVKTDEEFYDLGNRCDQLWRKHQKNDNLDPWDGSFLSDCRMFCYSVTDKDDQEDRDEEHNNAISSIKNYISIFH